MHRNLEASLGGYTLAMAHRLTLAQVLIHASHAAVNEQMSWSLEKQPRFLDDREESA